MVCLAWNDLIIPHSWCHNPKVPHCSLLPSSDRHSCKYHMHVMKVECSVSCPMKYLKRESSILYFLFFLPILHSHPWIYLSHYRMETFEKVSEGLIKSLSLSPHWISTLINILQPWSWGWNEYPEIITYERPQVSVKLVQSLSLSMHISADGRCYLPVTPYLHTEILKQQALYHFSSWLKLPIHLSSYFQSSHHIKCYF